MHRDRERIGSNLGEWINNKGTSNDSGWVRPSDWVVLPTINVGDKKFVGLYAVYNTNSNFCAVTCAGAYNIDWGDGTAAENIATGVAAEHIYTSASYTTLGSATDCSRGYRQTIITIIPQGAGTLTSINLGVRHSSENQIYSTQWLDIKWASAACTSFQTYSSTVYSQMLEQCRIIGTTSITDSSYMFCYCYSLQSIELFKTTSVTNFTYMFLGCYSLQTIPLFDTSGGITFTGMFSTCTNLRSVPLFNLSSGVTFTTMFDNCSSLQTVPLFNLVSGTTFTNMFRGCSALQTVPLFNLANGTAFSGMFQYDYSLRSVPLFNTVKGTTFASMFYQNYSLQSVPLFNFSAATTIDSMFYSCYSLIKVPLFDLSTGPIMTSSFVNCFSLQSLPLFNTSGVPIFTTTFSLCRSLHKATLDGTKVAISYLNCKLATADIVDIFNYLYDFREIMTINVSPATDWAAGDIITGQSSGKTCIVVSKIDATNYIVKTRDGTFTDAEEIGVTGTPAKLADQNAGAPTFAIIEVLSLDVAPATDWAANDIITGQSSGKTCTVVERFGKYLYSVKSRNGTYTLDESIGVTGTPAKIANQGAANPKFNGRGSTAITITGNWGAAALTAANNLIATNKGWSIVTA